MTTIPDDLSIADDEVLLRRIHPAWVTYNDDNPLQSRISSAAFQNYPNTDTMSVQLQSILHERGESAVNMLIGHDGYGIAAITAGHVRSCSQGVIRAATDVEPAHCHVLGPKKQSSVKREIAKGATLLIAPSPSPSR